MFYYGHGSWIFLVLIAATFVFRMMSSQRRRGGRSGTWGPGSSFTRGNPYDPTGRPPSGHQVSDQTATGTAPGWFADPFFKHEQRYWSGTEWTEHVTDHGSPGTDPPPSDPAPRRPG